MEQSIASPAFNNARGVKVSILRRKWGIEYKSEEK
jgi:hypothetical protein